MNLLFPSPLFACLLLTVQGAGAREPRPLTEEEQRGHQQMLDALAEVRRKTPEEHPFLETRTLRRLLPLLAEADTGQYHRRWVQNLTKAGIYQLREGKNAEAVESLKRAFEFCASLPEEERRTAETKLHYELALAYMRLGESLNCVARHTSQSCIMPIGETGVHVEQEGSRNAVAHFREVLRRTRPETPEHVASRWLLNVAYMTLGEYPDQVPEAERIDPSAFRSKVPFPHFDEIAADLGLDNPDISGSVVMNDFDHDGDLDIMTCSWDPAEDLNYYESEAGTYTERSAEARLTGMAGGLHMTPTDFNDDGELDLLVLRGAWIGEHGRFPKSLLQNQGDGTFLDVTYAAGLGSAYPSQTATWLDFDLDGDLDVYVGSESFDPEAPYPSELFRNEGHGRFTEIGAAAGVANDLWAKGVTSGDYDLDGHPDIYVSNYGGVNRLYDNEQDGTFRNVAAEVGVERPLGSFSTWFWDYDNDGNLDLYVSQYSGTQGAARVADVVVHYMGLPAVAEDTLKLYKGDGAGRFQDVSAAMGIAVSPQPMGSNFGDLDNDGFLDFYLSTGYPGYDGLTPNVMFHSARGKHFDDVTFAGGFGHLQKGHGVSFCDLDNDGDQDVFSQMGGAYLADGFGDILFENPGFGNHWLRLTLVGTECNRLAIGARIRVDVTEDGEKRSIFRDVDTGSSFGNNSLTQHVGLGRAAKADRIEVLWPRKGENVQVFLDVAADQQVRIVEGRKGVEPVPEKRFRLRE